MGLSIHFCGTLAQSSSINTFVDEVTDICDSLAWKWKRITTTSLNGIVFSVPECEPVFFTFTSAGKLCSPLQEGMEETYRKAGLDLSLIFWQSVKTQFAGITVHKALIALLRYLSQKYFQQFELNDEGLYWETNDEEVLHAQFQKYELALQAVTDALAGMQKQTGESTTDLAARIEAVLKQLQQRKG